MKNSTVTLIAVLLVLIVLGAVIGIWRSNSPEPQAPGLSPYPVATNSPAAPSLYTPPKTAPKTTTYTPPKTTTLPKTATSPTTSYVDYLTDLRAHQNACNNSASYEINQIYGTSLQSSSYTSYYNTVNGQCFFRFMGKLTPQYSATTTGYIYFRNASRDTLLAQCVDPTGTLFGDSNWTCTNKSTGATMNIAQFNALVGDYTTK